MTLLDDLEKKADSATPGEWRVETCVDRQFIRSLQKMRFGKTDHAIAEAWGGSGPRPLDAAFIATANPQTVKKLIQAIRVMREALEKHALLTDVATEALTRVREILGDE